MKDRVNSSLMYLQVLGRYYKKLYILEETTVKRVFGMVRQVETVYTMKNDTLYVDFLFR